MEIFNFQYRNNAVYRRWCDLIGRKQSQVQGVDEIPYLPISFFKSHKVVSFSTPEVDYFQSSGTTSLLQSRHWIKDPELYRRSYLANFRTFLGSPDQYSYLCLLPNYQAQPHSSLISMMKGLIAQSPYPNSGFYPHDLSMIRTHLLSNEAKGIPTVLFGVTYALLDLAQEYKFDLKRTIVFETGGMKGRRAEMPKAELHKILSEAFGVEYIASEYGMCELFSQAYSKGGGVFHTPCQMRVKICELNDPFSSAPIGRSGVVNLIDLANVDSCSFIATEDIGRLLPEGGFELLGRVDNSAIRGCNLMYEYAF